MAARACRAVGARIGVERIPACTKSVASRSGTICATCRAERACPHGRRGEDENDENPFDLGAHPLVARGADVLAVIARRPREDRRDRARAIVLESSHAVQGRRPGRYVVHHRQRPRGCDHHRREEGERHRLARTGGICRRDGDSRVHASFCHAESAWRCARTCNRGRFIQYHIVRSSRSCGFGAATYVRSGTSTQ